MEHSVMRNYGSVGLSRPLYFLVRLFGAVHSVSTAAVQQYTSELADTLSDA